VKDPETFASPDDEILAKDYVRVQSEQVAGSADGSSALSAKRELQSGCRDVWLTGDCGRDVRAPSNNQPPFAHFAGRRTHVSTSRIRHSAIITSAQKNEMKSL
jgi:hypothetical protein